MKNKRIITYGTFDLLHFGHLRILERAKALGNFLIVGVSTDEFNIVKNKTCVYPFEHRKQIVQSLRMVDEVIPEDNWDQKWTDIKNKKVDVLVMGDDWKNKFDHFKSICEVIYLPRTPAISTSMTIGKIKISQVYETQPASAYKENLS